MPLFSDIWKLVIDGFPISTCPKDMERELLQTSNRPELLLQFKYLIWSVILYFHDYISDQNIYLVLVFQDTVEVGDVADGEPQDLDLGELLVRGQGRQQASQRPEGGVKGLGRNPSWKFYTLQSFKNDKYLLTTPIDYW